MKRKTKIALGLVAAATVIGAIAIPALANSSFARPGFTGFGPGWSMMHFQGQTPFGPGPNGNAFGLGMMGRGPGTFGPGPNGGTFGPGMMMGRGQFGDMMQKMDANGDGTITPEEIHSQIQAKLSEFDADGNGSLSVTEFKAMQTAAIQERMGDRFGFLDADGNGEVTQEEMSAPADRMAEMLQFRNRMWGQQGGNQHDPSMHDDATDGN